MKIISKIVKKTYKKKQVYLVFIHSNPSFFFIWGSITAARENGGVTSSVVQQFKGQKKAFSFRKIGVYLYKRTICPIRREIR